MKPFVIERKNWLFSCTPKGVRTSLMIYSAIETMTEKNLKWFEYLKHVLETIPNIPPERHAELLPWSETLSDTCRRETPQTTHEKQ